ncbi:serine/threonine-protein kinase [Nonomuraea sp. NPDC049504]|uniref:serine/threonine-protein kinase n=1 Tax=Nonomuraea sp. NPDC049504 TaxID=3154729 RepID=UPI00342D244A
MDGVRQEDTQREADGRLLAGRYRLTGLLGRGGMGAVWAARDEQLGREVAAKELFLPEQLDDAERAHWIARLDREARAAARLKHPGIVTVHDHVTGADGRPWIIMELVRGRSLQDLLAERGPLPPARAARIGLQVLDALCAAHQAGITHRDIKPANVLLEGERVVLTDFGIAAVEGDVTLTGTGAILGTPAYMAPEQALGRPATPVSDLWSLGATLYTAVEGRPPYDGASAGAIFVAVATRDPAPPAKAGPLEPVLMALLRRDPAHRPAAHDVRAHLAAVAEDRTPPGPATLRLPADPPPSDKPGRPPRSGRLRLLLRLLVGAGAAVALVVAVAAAIQIREALQESQERERYAANMDLLAGLGTIPGKSVHFQEGEESTVEVSATLCEKEYATEQDRCDVGVLVDTVVEWLRTRPAVRSVNFTRPKEDCGDDYEDGGCRLTVLTQSPLKLSEVEIANFSEDGDKDLIKLRFIVG